MGKSNSRALDIFDQALHDWQAFLDIHEKVSGKKKGKRSKQIGVLNKSLMVLISASWESYLENVILESWRHICRWLSDPTRLSSELKSQIAKTILRKDNFDESTRLAWSLAGIGWKKIMEDYRKKVLVNELSKFHTPSSSKTIKLFRRTLGLQNLAASWKWKKMTTLRARKKLDKLIKIRGDIAHTGKTRVRIGKLDAMLYGYHVMHLVEETDMRVANHLWGLTRRFPWGNKEKR